MEDGELRIDELDNTQKRRDLVIKNVMKKGLTLKGKAESKFVADVTDVVTQSGKNQNIEKTIRPSERDQ